MSGFYSKHPTPGHIDPVSAIQMALADVAIAVEHAAKNEVWAGPGKWEPNSPVHPPQVGCDESSDNDSHQTTEVNL